MQDLIMKAHHYCNAYHESHQQTTFIVRRIVMIFEYSILLQVLLAYLSKYLYSWIQSFLEFKTPRKAHHVIGINRPSDLAKPLHVLTIHVHQRRTKKRVIHIFRRMRHILPIRKSSSANCAWHVAKRIGHRVIERGVGPFDGEDGREDSLRTVGRICRIAPVRKEAFIEGFKGCGHGNVIV